MKQIFNLSFLLFLSTAVFAQKYDLKYNLKINETYNQKMVSNIAIAQDVMGQKLNITMAVSYDTKFKIVEIKENYIKTKVTYQDIFLEMNITNLADANKPLNESFNRIMKAMKGKSFEMEMTSKGKVLKINGIDSIINSIFDSITDIAPETKAQLKTQLSESMGEKNFGSNMEQMTAFFPEKPVAKGEKWTSKMSVQSNYSFDMNAEYTLSEITPDFYILNGTAKILTPPTAETKQVSGMDVKIDLNGDMVYHIKIDRKTGWVVKCDMLQNLKGNSEILPNESIPDGMKIPMELKIEMVITN